MRKLMQVSWHEYWNLIGQRSFWLGTLGFPVMMAVLGLFTIVFLVAITLLNREPVGYVDYAGVLDGAVSRPGSVVEIRPYPHEDAARAALENEEIQAYYVLPADYRQSRQIDLYVLDQPPPEFVGDSFKTLLRAQLLVDADETTQRRIVEGADISLQSAAANPHDSAKTANTIAKVGLLFAVVFSLFIIMADVSGYASMIVEDERKNRTLEILMTTLTPNQFVIGKILGLTGVALTRPLVWLLLALPFLAALWRSLPPVYQQAVDVSFILIMAAFLVPGIVLFFGLISAASVLIADPRFSGQLSGLLNMSLMLSMFLGLLIAMDTAENVVIFFSFFPLTSFMVMPMRLAAGDVPAWQLAASWLILVAAATGSLWLAARLFRAGRALTGKTITWPSVRSRLRLRRPA
ncbi:MAG: ABC transporter permease [Chloroflexi bacterium]|nr:ABC transporter permease [Chloroflexota bacterium]